MVNGERLVKISALVLKVEPTIHSSGYTMIKPIKIRTKYLKKVATLARAFIPINQFLLQSVSIVDPVLLAAKCDDSEQGDDDEHDPGHGAGHTHFVALERIVVNQQRNQRDGTAGAAIIKDNVGTVEFLERLSNLGNEVVEDNGGDHRHGDLYASVPGGGLSGLADGEDRGFHY